MAWLFSSDDHRKAIKEIEQTQSDRATVIVGAAFVERDLRNAIEARLRPDENYVNKLFKPTGPIGTFGAKIDLGFMLRIYEKHTLEDLERISTMRNRFAHHVQPLTFKSKEIKNLCKGLQIVDTDPYPKVPGKGLPDKHRSPPRLGENAGPRDHFIQAVKLMSILFWAESHNYVMGSNSKHVWRPGAQLKS